MKNKSIQIFAICFILQITAGVLKGQNNIISLVSPMDGDTLIYLRPAFNWNAMGFGERNSFLMKLCKVESDQVPEFAIQANQPTCLIGPILTLSSFYPFHLPDLDSNSQYCWQVTMYQDGYPVAFSDVSNFFTPHSPVHKYVYWNLNNSKPADVFSNRFLTFSFTNTYRAREAKLIITKNDSHNSEIYNGMINLSNGINHIHCEKLAGFPSLPNGNYKVMFQTDRMKEKFGFTFNRIQD